MFCKSTRNVAGTPHFFSLIISRIALNCILSQFFALGFLFTQQLCLFIKKFVIVSACTSCLLDSSFFSFTSCSHSLVFFCCHSNCTNKELPVSFSSYKRMVNSKCTTSESLLVADVDCVTKYITRSLL